jgi:hypothetical protein
MYLDTALLIAGFGSLLLFGLIAYGLKISQNTQSMIILLMICSFMYMYLFGLDRYRESNYQKALDAPQQISTCAVFVRQIQFNISRKQQSETAFQFKTAHSEFLEFNGDPIAFQHIRSCNIYNLVILIVFVMLRTFMIGMDASYSQNYTLP